MYAWLIVARRLLVARGVDRLIAEYIFRVWDGPKLSFRGSGISSIPARLSELQNLQLLDVSGCKLDGLWPRELAECRRLKGVFASNNRIRHVPVVLSMVPSLATLHLGANLLSAFEAENVAGSNLKELFLSSNELAHMPDLSTFTTLQQLFLDKNRFSIFPAGITSAAALTWLLLDSNRIERIPDCISQLTALEVLSICGNWVVALPASMGALVRLKKLMMKNNLVSSVCEEIGELRRLDFLDLTDNRLENLPRSMGHMRSTDILIAQNTLSLLPPEFRGMQKVDEPLAEFLRSPNIYQPPAPLPIPAPPSPPPPPAEPQVGCLKGCLGKCNVQ